jgi:hypothetical protein
MLSTAWLVLGTLLSLVVWFSILVLFLTNRQLPCLCTRIILSCFKFDVANYLLNNV